MKLSGSLAGGKAPVDDVHRPLTPEVREQIVRAQIDVRAHLAVRMAVIGMVVTFAIGHMFWNAGIVSLLRGGLCAAAVLYVVLFVTARLWIAESHQGERFKYYRIAFALLQFLIGSAWSAVLIAGLGVPSPVERSVLYALAVALMSTPVFTGPAEYSLALWTPITVGFCMAILINSTGFPVVQMVILVAYAYLSFTTILSVNTNTIEREARRIEAERQSEVIGLLLRDFEEGASDFLWETDTELNLLRPSRRFAEAACTDPATLAATTLPRFLAEHGAEMPDRTPPEAINALVERVKRMESFNEPRVSLHFGGTERCWSLVGKPVVDDRGNFAGYRGVGSDVTAHRSAERRIAHIASHDSLTNLGNRMSFDAALQAACAAPTEPATALVYLDLDHFKSVNDRFGHKTGDELLKAAAGRIRGCVRSHDQCFRLGGDEFALILPETGVEEATAITGRIVGRLADPFSLGDVTLALGACAGIAMITCPGIPPEDILHSADLALYRAKADGRGRLHVFDAESDRETTRLRQINAALANAFDSQVFFLEYQPIVRLDTGAVSAVEALIRWDHPEYGILPPDQFIPIAEHNGAIVRIGARVIDAASAFAASLPEHITVAINLSPVQLHDPGLLGRIGAALRRNRLGPGRIEFELTETAILDLSAETLHVLHGIRNLGCRLSLDDFGAGYSSIATLYYFRFDRLKVDRSLIRDSMNDSRRRTILHNITRLARDIGLVVTAEGAETPAHRAVIAELGFEEMQGSLFSLPLSDMAMHAWLGLHAARHREEV